MGEYIKEGEMVEGMKCSIYTRKIEFKRRTTKRPYYQQKYGFI